MVKINNTSIFTINTDPADDDLVLGTDVSNTSNDPDGETVNFRVDAITGGPKLLQTVSPDGSQNSYTLSFDNTKFNSYLIIWEHISGDDTGIDAGNVEIRLSTDDGSTTVSSGYLGKSIENSGTTLSPSTYTGQLLTAPQFGTSNSSGYIWIHGTASTGSSTFYSGAFTAGAGATSHFTVEGAMSAVGSHNAAVIGILQDATENLTGGEIRLYGIRG
jgi:hypothetical protein